MPSLYGIWLEAHNKGILAQEWRLAHNFLTWATANRYKVEYGYKGEFTPENLLAAKLKREGCGNERDAAANEDCMDGGMGIENLEKMTVQDLKELADKMGITVRGLRRKDEIINAICGGE